MSIADLGGAGSTTGASGLHHRTHPRRSGADPFSLDATSGPGGALDAAATETGVDAGSDELQVKLPNGFTVSAIHNGGSGSAFDAQLLSSMEDMIGYLNKLTPTDGKTSSDTAVKDGSTTPQASGGMRCCDTFGTDLGDGNSVTIHYGTESDGGNTDHAAAEAMAAAIDRIIKHYQGQQTAAAAPDLASLYDEVTKGKS